MDWQYWMSNLKKPTNYFRLFCYRVNLTFLLRWRGTHKFRTSRELQQTLYPFDWMLSIHEIFTKRPYGQFNCPRSYNSQLCEQSSIWRTGGIEKFQVILVLFFKILNLKWRIVISDVISPIRDRNGLQRGNEKRISLPLMGKLVSHWDDPSFKLMEAWEEEEFMDCNSQEPICGIGTRVPHAETRDAIFILSLLLG